NFTITFTATDNGDGNGTAAILSGTQSFVLTVNSPNVPPHLAPIGTKVAVVGQPLQLALVAADLDQDPLTFSAIGLPGNASLTSGSVYGQGIINWTPNAGDLGKYAVLVKVADSGNGNPTQVLSDQQGLTLVVRTGNQAPVFVPAGNPTV